MKEIYAATSRDRDGIERIIGFYETVESAGEACLNHPDALSDTSHCECVLAVPVGTTLDLNRDSEFRVFLKESPVGSWL